MLDDDLEPEPLDDDASLDDVEEDAELADWKERMRRQFEAWLETVEAIPEPVENEPGGAAAEQETPDLYSLYAELAALRNENRKGNRKAAELFSQFGTSLGGFEEEMKRLRGQLTRLEATQPGANDLPRAHCLALVEMLDRLRRLRAGLERLPSPTRFAFLGTSAAWREAWESLRQGFDILLTHLEKLLAQAGLKSMSTLGQPFDPTTMIAIAAVVSGDRPANVVLEEVSAGYLWRNEVLRPAEVKITKQNS